MSEMRKKFFAAALVAAIGSIFQPSEVLAEGYCLSTDLYCQQAGKGQAASEDEAPAYPMVGEGSLFGFSLNPASVPVRKAVGVGAIFYKIRPSYLLLSGTGRVGAAISPSNGDDTFFGNPSFETEADYLARQDRSLPFEQIKLALGLAASVYDNEKVGFEKFQITVGALGRYVHATKAIRPGGGINLIAGPLLLGGAYSLDETKLGAEDSAASSLVKTKILSLTGGLMLGSVMLDYTKLNLKPEGMPTTTPVDVELANVSLLLKRFILSAAYRIETSDRKKYDAESRSLIVSPKKEAFFGGVQFAVLPNAQIGVFYNYYLLDELSGGITVFF